MKIEPQQPHKRHGRSGLKWGAAAAITSKGGAHLQLNGEFG